jgi:hypothetical protein
MLFPMSESGFSRFNDFLDEIVEELEMWGNILKFNSIYALFLYKS